MQPARRLCRASGRPIFTLLSSAVCALLMACLYFVSLAQSETDSRRPSSELNNPLKCANCKLMDRLKERGPTTPWPNRRKWKIEIGVKNTIAHATTASGTLGVTIASGGARGLCVPAGWGRLTPTRPSWHGECDQRLRRLSTLLLMCLYMAPQQNMSAAARSALAAHHLSERRSVGVSGTPPLEQGWKRPACASIRPPPSTRAPRSLAWPPFAPIQNKDACCRRRAHSKRRHHVSFFFAIWWYVMRMFYNGQKILFNLDLC
jgi:hypothetical protein